MIINCELDEDEQTALCLLMGMGTGCALDNGIIELAGFSARLMNKLLANSRNFIPYDEKSFDPERKNYPFKTVTPQ